MSNKVTYKNYNMNQLQIPMDITDWIEENHISKLINQVVEGIDEKILRQSYKGGGRCSYHPKMMLKIIIYAYINKVTSGRKIEKLCKENLPMIWLAARQTPDFRTINRFRVEKKELIEEVFKAIVLRLIDAELIDPSIYYLDGTKIEANANKYTFVWKKSTQRYKEKITEKITEFLEEASNLSEEELKQEETVKGLSELKELSREILQDIDNLVSKEVQQIVEVLEEIKEEQEIQEIPKNRKRVINKITKKIKKDYLPRLQKYENQLEILKDRNSYSKTDKDATFMRMKEDHMKNGQLKAGYNIQVGTHNQYVLGFTIHQNPTDVRTLQSHIENIKEQGIIEPKIIVADAGYGSEENYIYCEENNYQALIPYSMMRKEQMNKYKKDIKNSSNWKYDVFSDSFVCANNRYVDFEKYISRTDKYGYKRDFKQYKCEDCSDCPIKHLCTKAKGNRTILYNPTYEELKAKQRYLLLENEETKNIYSKRKIEIESFFGNLKQNLAFTRFSLRGIENVRVEFALHAISHNLIKLAKHLIKQVGLADFIGKYFSFFRIFLKNYSKSQEKNFYQSFLGFSLCFWVSPSFYIIYLIPLLLH